jgi:HlyD family secretion protein
MVPNDAVVSFAGVHRVFVADGGKAREQRITTGRRSGEDVEVIEGLEAGDRVVRSPGDLADGVAIRENAK